MPPGISPEAFAALFALTVFAAAVQRLSGIGFGTIVAPFAALAAVDYLPAAILLLGLPITVAGASMDLRRDQLREIAPMVAGRALGAVPAAMLVGALAGRAELGAFIALTILVGVGLSLAGLSVRRTPATRFGAGALSGFLATISSVGAAPIAMLYQDERAASARGGLNAYFLIGLLISLAGLASQGLVAQRHVWLALLLSPAVAAGVWLSVPLARHVDGKTLKPWALGLSTIAAMALLGRSLA